MRSHILDHPISYYAIFLTVRYLPVRLCHWLGNVVVLIVYVFSKKDRQGLAANLAAALNARTQHHHYLVVIRQKGIIGQSLEQGHV